MTDVQDPPADASTTPRPSHEEGQTTPRSQDSLRATRSPEVVPGEHYENPASQVMPGELHANPSSQVDRANDAPCPAQSIHSVKRPPAVQVSGATTAVGPTRTPTPTPSVLESDATPPEAGKWQQRRNTLKLQGYKLWILVGGIFGVILLLLAVPTGVERHKHKNVSPPQAYGVVNGTGDVALDLGDGSDTILLYRQAWDGSIRKSTYINGTWTGGDLSDAVVAPNARRGTPLMAVSFVRNEELIWRVFYIDTSGILQEAINSNKTSGGWSSGLLGAGLHQASSSQHVGLTACHNAEWYGAPYNSSEGGLRLYYGTANSSVQELQWADGNGAWDTGDYFPDSNGDGGVECTVGHFGQPPSVTNLWLLDQNGNLEQRWMDFNLTANTSTHPTGSWVRGVTYAGLRQNTAISAITSQTQKLINVQMPNNTIRQLISTGNSETSQLGAFVDVTGYPGIAGTRIGSAIVNTTMGGQEVHLFYQSTPNTTTDYVRTLDGESWSVQDVTMPR